MWNRAEPETLAKSLNLGGWVGGWVGGRVGGRAGGWAGGWVGPLGLPVLSEADAHPNWPSSFLLACLSRRLARLLCLLFCRLAAVQQDGQEFLNYKKIKLLPTLLASCLLFADAAVQQDGQEFLKLLLTLLESRFSGQAGEVAGLIQALFRGQSGYRTVCQVCQRKSGAPLGFW